MSIACRREEDFDKEQKEEDRGYADFRELYKGEVPRIHLPRTWVNRGRCVRYSRAPYSRTTNTGQWAWRTTESETLPINALLKRPRPRLPTTMSPAPSSPASPTICASGLPILACASATSPLSPTCCICSSSFVLASCWALSCILLWRFGSRVVAPGD